MIAKLNFYIIIALITNSCYLIKKNNSIIYKEQYKLLRTTPNYSDTRTFKGTVYDSYTKKKVNFGFVVLSTSESLHATIKEDGRFQITFPNSNDSIFNIEVSSVGCSTMTLKDFLIKNGNTTELQITLGTSVIY